MAGMQRIMDQYSRDRYISGLEDEDEERERALTMAILQHIQSVSSMGGGVAGAMKAGAETSGSEGEVESTRSVGDRSVYTPYTDPYGRTTNYQSPIMPSQYGQYPHSMRGSTVFSPLGTYRQGSIYGLPDWESLIPGFSSRRRF